jgi:hypothetical protein
MAGTAGRCEIQGDLKIHPPGPKEREFRGTWKLDRRQSWKMQDSGTPGDSSQGGTGGEKIRGAPRIRHQDR